MNAAGLNLVLFLGIVGFSIYRSKQRLTTVLFTLMAVVLTLAIVVAVAQVVPTLNTGAIGAATFDASLLVGMLTALIHSTRTRPAK